MNDKTRVFLKKQIQSFLFRVQHFFTDPFYKKGVISEVPWTAQDGVKVILFSTVLFTLIVFGGFFFGAFLIDAGYIPVPDTLDDLGLSMSGSEAIDMGIFTGFDIMSLLLLDHFSFLITAGIVLQVLLQIFMLVVYSRWKYGAKLSHFGFRKLPAKMLLGMVFGLFVLSILIQNGYLSFVGILGIENAQQNGGAEQLVADGMVPLPILFLFAGVAAPVLEEIIFRGFFLAGAVRRSGTLTALIASALFFAFAHMNPSIFMPSIGAEGLTYTLPAMSEVISTFILMPIYFMLGILLGFAFLRSNSLYPGITFHMINNNAALILLLMHLNQIQ